MPAVWRRWAVGQAVNQAGYFLFRQGDSVWENLE